MEATDIRSRTGFAPVGIVFVAPLATGIRSAIVFGAIAVAILVLAAVGGSRIGGDSERNSTTEDDANASNDVWNAIPSWQYGGRHAESGGLSRDEQERALAEIQEQAAELEGERDG